VYHSLRAGRKNFVSGNSRVLFPYLWVFLSAEEELH